MVLYTKPIPTTVVETAASSTTAVATDTEIDYPDLLPLTHYPTIFKPTSGMDTPYVLATLANTINALDTALTGRYASFFKKTEETHELFLHLKEIERAFFINPKPVVEGFFDNEGRNILKSCRSLSKAWLDCCRVDRAAGMPPRRVRRAKSDLREIVEVLGRGCDLPGTPRSSSSGKAPIRTPLKTFDIEKAVLETPSGRSERTLRCTIDLNFKESLLSSTLLSLSDRKAMPEPEDDGYKHVFRLEWKEYDILCKGHFKFGLGIGEEDVSFTILEGLPYDIVLGRDWIEKHDIFVSEEAWKKAHVEVKKGAPVDAPHGSVVERFCRGMLEGVKRTEKGVMTIGHPVHRKGSSDSGVAMNGHGKGANGSAPVIPAVRVSE